MPKEVKRGEIYWVDWNPGRGSEQIGLRPSLVIQNDVGNTHSPTTIVAAHTTSIDKPYPFLVAVSTKESGLPRNSMADLANIMTVDKIRLGEKCGELNDLKMIEINHAIKASLGL